MSDARRPRRVAEAIRAELLSVITRELSDPILVGLTITQVDVPADLGHALVSVRALQEGNEAHRRALVRHLERAASRLRRTIGPTLRLRRVPELRFQYDQGPDASQRVEELLAEIRREEAARPADEAAQSADEAARPAGGTARPPGDEG